MSLSQSRGWGGGAGQECRAFEGDGRTGRATATEENGVRPSLRAPSESWLARMQTNVGFGTKANVGVTRPCRLQFRCSSTCLGQPGDASRFPWGSVSRTDANKPCHRKGNRLPARRKDSPLCGIGHAVMAVHRGVSWRFMAPVARFPCARSELEKLSAFSTKIVHVMKKQSVSGAASSGGTGG